MDFGTNRTFWRFTLEKKKKDRIIDSWQSLCGILVRNKETDLETIREHVSRAPGPHKFAAQAILANSGCAIQGFVTDGRWGDWSDKSLTALHQAYNEVITNQSDD